MTDKRGNWKGLERKTAKKLDGERVICSGVRGEGDVITKKFYVECKMRKKFACWEWFRKAKEQAKKEGKIPLLVIKMRGKKGELAIVDFSDFCALVEK
jgi:hypothetical protein